MKGFRSTALALGIASGLSGAAPSSADVVINGSFYEETMRLDPCGSASICSMEMTPPTQKVLFTKLNCSIVPPSGKIMHRVSFAVRDTHNASFDRRREFLETGSPSVAFGLNFYTKSWETNFLFAPGKIPTITANWDGSASGGSIECKLTGQIQQ